LPAHEVPRHVLVVDALPRNARGDVDIGRLPLAGLAAEARSDAVSGDAPKSPQEKLLATIWSELLEIPDISVRDNFFDLGGHSLLMVRVNRRLREEFDREVSMIDLFRYPTVSALAEFLSHEPQATAAAAAADSSGKVQARKDSAAAQKELRERRRQLKARVGA